MGSRFHWDFNDWDLDLVVSSDVPLREGCDKL